MGDPFADGFAHEGMKPLPSMPAAIFLAFIATLVACHLALISDLLMVTIIFVLLIVLIATEPDSGECDQPHTRSQSILIKFSPEKFLAASRIFAASRRRSLGLSRRHAFPAPAHTSRRSLADAGSGPVGVADAVHPRRQTLARAIAGIKFID